MTQNYILLFTFSFSFVLSEIFYVLIYVVNLAKKQNSKHLYVTYCFVFYYDIITVIPPPLTYAEAGTFG